MAMICICRGSKSGGRRHGGVPGRASGLSHPRPGGPAAGGRRAGRFRGARWKKDEWTGPRSGAASRPCAAPTSSRSRPRWPSGPPRGHLVYHGLAGGLLLRRRARWSCASASSRPWRAACRGGDGRVRDERGGGASATSAISTSRGPDGSKVMYGEDIMDPALYDLVVNLSHDVRGGRLRGRDAGHRRAGVHPHRAPCATGWRTSGSPARSSLALAGDPDLRSLELEAEARRRGVVIPARCPCARAAAPGIASIELARGVPGVESPPEGRVVRPLSLRHP